MKRTILMLLFVSALVFNFSCKSDKKEDTNDTEMESEVGENDDMEEEAEIIVKKVTVALSSKSDSQATGNVVFTEENGKVKMVAVLSGLAQGTHAIHLHETADCSAADATSSGGHWNPTAEPHGKWGDPKGYHKGDIGNFEANENGNGTIRFETDQWCIDCGDSTKDILGKAVVVHQGTDDFTSQPSGDAGARVSCGGVIK